MGFVVLVVVFFIVYFYYRNWKIVIFVVSISFFEVIIIFGIVVFIKWNFDLLSIVGIIVVIGMGVD